MQIYHFQDGKVCTSFFLITSRGSWLAGSVGNLKLSTSSSDECRCGRHDTMQRWSEFPWQVTTGTRRQFVPRLGMTPTLVNNKQLVSRLLDNFLFSRCILPKCLTWGRNKSEGNKPPIYIILYIFKWHSTLDFTLRYTFEWVFVFQPHKYLLRIDKFYCDYKGI